MATIANLVVKIAANNKALRSALKDTAARVKKLAGQIRRGLGKAIKVAFAAGAAAAAAFTVAINRAADRVDKLAKTGAKIGIGVKELQKLQLQAKLSGVSTETLNMALQRMVRRVSEAALGTGEAVKALKELGIDAKDLSRLSVDKQFEQIAQAFKGIGQQGDKVRLAMKLFDSEGVALVNTLASNLNKVSKEFDALGLGISKSQATAVEAFQDSKTMALEVFDAIANKVTAELAPAMTSLVQRFTDWIKEMGGADIAAKKIAATIVSGGTTVIDTVLKIVEGYRLLGIVITDLKPVAIGVFDSMGFALDRYRMKLTNVFEAIANINTAFRTMVADIAHQPGFSDFDPNAPGDPNAPAAMAARGAREREEQRQIVEVVINADKDGILNAVISSQAIKTIIERAANRSTKDAARATRR